MGHAKLTTTEIYTQVSIRQLKAIHSACHPSSKLKRPDDPADDPALKHGLPDTPQRNGHEDRPTGSP